MSDSRLRSASGAAATSAAESAGRSPRPITGNWVMSVVRLTTVFPSNRETMRWSRSIRLSAGAVGSSESSTARAPTNERNAASSASVRVGTQYFAAAACNDNSAGSVWIERIAAHVVTSLSR
ncbi:Uncharacterised protein [Mycobacteroides abscessus subsp. abscessus]|nr:Uncharacterised protein [Mycobacteroides abscessus subsp. abscessus]